MNRLTVGLLIATITIRVAFIGITWAGLTLLAQFAFVFGWNHWWTNRRIDRLDDQVLISDNRVVTWYKKSEETSESIAHLQKYGPRNYWPSWFSLPYVGDGVKTADGTQARVTDVHYDISSGMNIIDVEQI